MMRGRLRRLGVPTLAFFVIAVVVVGWVAFPLWNYTKFYIALWNFDFTLSNITLERIDPENVQVRVDLLISNPTSYSGLSVSVVSYDLQYVDGTRYIIVPRGKGTESVPTNLWDLSADSFTENLSLPPNSNKTISFLVNVNYVTDTSGFSVLLMTQPSQVEWSLYCSMIVVSFLTGFTVERTFPPFSTPINH